MSSKNLIHSDVKIMRDYYDDALLMLGIPAKYQYPIFPDTNVHGEPVIDHYSVSQDVYIFFEGSPKIKTFKRLGWVVANDEDIPFLIHCSFNLQHLQKDCIFQLSGQYSEVPDRKFRVTELSTDLQCPDHVICQVVPIYKDGIKSVGRTRKELDLLYNKSNRFIKNDVDYRGNYRSELPGDR